MAVNHNQIEKVGQKLAQIKLFVQVQLDFNILNDQ